MNQDHPASFTTSKDQHVNDYLEVLAPFQRSILLPLRQEVLDTSDDWVEGMRWSSLTFSRDNQIRVVVHAAKDFISLVFPQGHTLNDPNAQLSESDGNARSLAFSDPESLDLDTLHFFLKQLTL
ncbi:MAG: DUF1801 domain-containing protein [Salibacteraceae bacterium]